MLGFLYEVQQPMDEDDSSTIQEPLDILVILLVITTMVAASWLLLTMLARFREGSSAARLVLTDKSMVFNGYYHYPLDSVVHLYTKPASSLMLGPEGRLVGAVDGRPTESLVLAVDTKGGGADWYEIPVALQGEQLTRVLEGLRGCLPGLIVSARSDW